MITENLEKIIDTMMTLDIDDNKEVVSVHKEYPIKSFDWVLEFIFNQGSYSENDIKTIADNVGSLISKSDGGKYLTLFSKSTYNSAVAVSDSKNRRSVILLSKVTSLEQFVNSLTHEILHLSRHIDKCDNNEELFTILGNIAGDIIDTLYNQ